MKKIFKWIIGILIILIIIIGATFAVVKHMEYQPTSAALKASETTTSVSNTIKFQGDDTKPVVIFYPGALVDPLSYSIWANKLARAGYTVYIVRFPLDLAVINANAAKEVQNGGPYIICGHSLGGTMAARYAHKNTKELKGVFLLGSYPEKKGNLRNVKEPVISITASRDGVLNQKAYKKSKKYLPKNTDFVTINGGNHAGFGSYGKQSGDNSAKISNSDQQKIVADLLLRWLDKIK
ncbi:alpha/beta hydrolase [Companilactobacillus allii]|uniref:Alpha/beta hydrolase n=1 Tax=Companilactobacillus allii TaxID=1847728 RepID=A0A1P8Q5N8_9LACO|nr:alpha/beta hydrolase [Companilactobacillus allii]APX73162.1 alpha/beta hydrolase [Companilactobacillus allii]USQ67969.1 alpha/beta hydrolase [Companilactobacillus allii]